MQYIALLRGINISRKKQNSNGRAKKKNLKH